MKKLLAMLLAVLMLISMMSVTAWADDDDDTLITVDEYDPELDEIMYEEEIPDEESVTLAGTQPYTETDTEYDFNPVEEGEPDESNPTTGAYILFSVPIMALGIAVAFKKRK
ncbi:MAG: hypothetical protein LUE20_05855 [Oscillospiraceae bacterium]|nr:hypothetical protein [Oscillospiraceae bacterium]